MEDDGGVEEEVEGGGGGRGRDVSMSDVGEVDEVDVDTLVVATASITADDGGASKLLF